jgi:NADH dehydrogenase
VSSTANAQPIVAVDGATGYLGNHLVARLRSAGLTVYAIVHPRARAADLEFLKSTGAKVIEASLKGKRGPSAALTEALKGVDIAVHLIGSIAPRKGEKLADLHGNQTANLVAAAKAAGVKKLVQVTALGAAKNASNSYHRTKWQAEEYVRNSGLRWVIFRPSLIVGKQVGNRDSKLVSRYLDLIGRRSTIPVIGKGSNRLQPVFVGDLVTALEKAICETRFDNNAYEIGGDEILSMRQLVEKLMVARKANKKISGVKPLAAKMLAAVCETVQTVPLISRDQIKLSMSDNVCANNSLRTVFGIAPTDVETALAAYRKENKVGGALEGSGHRG